MSQVTGLGVLAAIAAAVGAVVWAGPDGRAAPEQPGPRPEAKTASLDDTAIGAVIAANGGKPPRTGEELIKVLGRLGKFAQLPVVFSAVHLESGLNNPRVVIAEVVKGLSDVDANRPNLAGRLFLAANMERGENGADPRVRSVEFISWNTIRRQFDFGVIDNMGGPNQPELRIVDGGRCFVCHKNRGPILGTSPWTNTTHHTMTRLMVMERLSIGDSDAVGGAGRGHKRNRIDGMALAMPEASAVDAAVRFGAAIRPNRDTFRLISKSPLGRNALTAMLVAITEPGPLDPDHRTAKQAVERWGNDTSYFRFVAEGTELFKATNSGILVDYSPIPQTEYEWQGIPLFARPLSKPPITGIRTKTDAIVFEDKIKKEIAEREASFAAAKQAVLTADAGRIAGQQLIPSSAQPSNAKAFIQPAVKVTKATNMVNPVLLAGVIGLTEGDRKFLSRGLADATNRLKKQNVPATRLAQQVFEGPEFADVLAGGPLPDRDEFKDRFVAGLDTLLKTRYKLAAGFAPDRKEYASSPRYDPKVAEQKEAAVVPTTACLRCHDVRASGKPRAFEPIAALPFDPFDKAGRAAWVRTAEPKRKQEVLTRLMVRLHEDEDMPPTDAPEYDLFRVKGAAAFVEVKGFLEAELAKLNKQ